MAMGYMKISHGNRANEKSVFITEKPYIELDLREKQKNVVDRTKRTLDCHENSVTTGCCRYPMTIDFSGIGWDWVLAPKTLDVNYCSGECNSSNSHYIQFVNQAQQVMWSPGTKLIMACCVPKSQSGIKIMYFGKQDRIEFGVINEIIVESCGCT